MNWFNTSYPLETLKGRKKKLAEKGMCPSCKSSMDDVVPGVYKFCQKCKTKVLTGVHIK